MGKRNQDGELKQLYEAIDRFKNIGEQDSDNNPKFIEALNMAKQRLLEELHRCVGQRFNKANN